MPAGLNLPAASPEYTAYQQPQRPDAPPRPSAHESAYHHGNHFAQVSPQHFAGFGQPELAGHPQQPPWYPPASGYGPPGTPAAHSEWSPAQQQQFVPRQSACYGSTPVDQWPGGAGLHPSQTDLALTILMQRAHVGDPTAQRVMANHWGQQAAVSTGNFSPAASMEGGRPPPSTRVDLSRVTITGINMDTAELAQNSLYTFRNACARLGVPMSGGDPQQDLQLGQLVELWCEKSSKVVTSLRTTFPVGGSGYDKLRHVEQVFITPKVLARDKNPEDAVAAFSFSQMYKGSGLDFHDKAQQLRELTARLPAAVRGDDRYWIERTRNAAGIAVSFYYDRVLLEMIEQDDDVTQAEVKNNWTIFVRVMAAAIDRSRRDAHSDSSAMATSPAQATAQAKANAQARPSIQPAPAYYTQYTSLGCAYHACYEW